MSKCAECSAFFICYDKGKITDNADACAEFTQRQKHSGSITQGDRIRLLDNQALAERFVHRTKAVDSYLALFRWKWCATKDEAILSNKQYLDEVE